MTYPRGQEMAKAMGCKEQNYKRLEDNIENYITSTQRKASLKKNKNKKKLQTPKAIQENFIIWLKKKTNFE